MDKEGLPDLPVAQFLRLRRHIPPLYGVLAVNAAALAYTHRHVAPLYLTVVVASVLVLACLQRIYAWTRPIDPAAITGDQARAIMRRTTVLGITMTLVFLVWALALDQYGTAAQQGHVMLFIAATLLGCIFCLTYLPQAAVAISVLAIGMFTLYCVKQGSEERLSIACSTGLITILILFVVRDCFASFVSLEESRSALIIGQRRAERLEAESARLARIDALTQLPNRRRFFEELEALLREATSQTRFSIGLLDLDGFKPVNDTHGHAQGNRLLAMIGDRLVALCKAHEPGVSVARLGGDEFGFIIQAEIDEACDFMQGVCRVVQEPVPLDGMQIAVGASGGVAAYPLSGSDANKLFDRADFALYHAKRHQRGHCVKFSHLFEQLIRADQLVESALQTADLAQEIALVFQPIYDIQSKAAVCVEALARWTSPVAGPVPPETLVAAAEKLGILRVVTLALFDRAIAACAQLPAHLRVSFNLSAGDLANPETVDAILDAMTSSGQPGRRFIFEITETALISSFATAVREIDRLRASGAKIALDDFGTGFSSFNSLQELPLDILKIDKTFTGRIEDPAGRRVVRGILSLAHSMSLECVIEGVETEGQLEAARELGFRYGQGYCLARPAALAEIDARIA